MLKLKYLLAFTEVAQTTQNNTFRPDPLLNIKKEHNVIYLFQKYAANNQKFCIMIG